MYRKKKAVLLSSVMWALLLLMEGIQPAKLHAEETQKAYTPVQIMVYGNRNNVEFQVKGNDGKAVKGASIDIRNGKAEWLFYGTTDSNGRKSLWMPLAAQKYRVYKSGYETAEGSFTVKNLLSKIEVKIKLKKKKSEKPSPSLGLNDNKRGKTKTDGHAGIENTHEAESGSEKEASGHKTEREEEREKEVTEGRKEEKSGKARKPKGVREHEENTLGDNDEDAEEALRQDERVDLAI